MRRDSESSKCTSRHSARHSVHNNCCSQFISHSGCQMPADCVVPTCIEHFFFILLLLRAALDQSCVSVCKEAIEGKEEPKHLLTSWKCIGNHLVWVEPGFVITTPKFFYLLLKTNICLRFAHRIKLVGLLDMVTKTKQCWSCCDSYVFMYSVDPWQKLLSPCRRSCVWGVVKWIKWKSTTKKHILSCDSITVFGSIPSPSVARRTVDTLFTLSVGKINEETPPETYGWHPVASFTGS